MSRHLWFRLVLPLIILSGSSLAIHGCWEAGGFFINLSTELLGIVLTVAYVDWVLKTHRSAQWAGAESRIGDRLEVLVNGIISSVRGCRLLGRTRPSYCCSKGYVPGEGIF